MLVVASGKENLGKITDLRTTGFQQQQRIPQIPQIL